MLVNILTSLLMNCGSLTFDNVACRHIIRKCPHALLDRLVKELSARAAPLTVGCELYASNSFWQALFLPAGAFQRLNPTSLPNRPRLRELRIIRDRKSTRLNSS